MFNKPKDTPSPEFDAPMNTASSSSTKRSAMKSKAPSILSADLSVKGSIASEGEVQLDGSVDGDVRAVTLTIGEEASVNGEVIAENVVVRGRIVGSIRARQVQLASTARVEGDIIHATLAVESGAYFDGHCRRNSDPLSDKAKSSPANDKPGVKAPPAPATSTAASAPKPAVGA